MKKLLNHGAGMALVILAGLTFCRAEVQPGIMIGLGSFSETLKNIDGGTPYSLDSRTGFLAGGLLDIPFSRYLSLQNGIMYSERGEAGLRLEYLAIPVDLKLKYPASQVFSPYALAGVNLGILLDAAYVGPGGGGDVTSSYTGADFGFDLGLGVDCNAGPVIPFFELSYYFGIAHVYVDPQDNSFTTNFGLQIMAGIRFKT